MSYPRQSVHARLNAKIDKAGPLVSGMIDVCHLWLGAINGKGEPIFWLDRKVVRAQRAVLMLDGDPLCADAWILNLCGNRICVNHLHLVSCTKRDAVALRRSGNDPLYRGDIRLICDVIRCGTATVDDVAQQYGLSSGVIREMAERMHQAEQARSAP